MIWLLSAYRSDSHAAWIDWLRSQFDEFDWQVLELPGRHFAWRIRSNPLSWLDRLPEKTPDLVLATSMVDLATLKGLNPGLAGVPCWYYFHENQFAYPVSNRQVHSVEPKMIQLYGALAADRLLFNSAYNRNSFLDGMEPFLQNMPDEVPTGLPARLEPKCRILPVPVAPVAPGPERDRRLIVWNHRWEYDKLPEVFADAMIELARIGHDFRLALLGKRLRQAPEPLARLRQHLSDRIIADGKLPDARYRQLLGRAGIAVSTAAHEFQGISMLEATSAGACPLVPDALCYREQYPAENRYRPGNTGELVTTLQQWLVDGPPPVPDISPWLGADLLPRWRKTLEEALA